MNLVGIFFVAIIGLIIGSFLTSLTYRLPRNISIASGRSLCPKCGKKISWRDNIPVFSYIILSGKCRNCGKKISPRYPLIELITALLFILIYFYSTIYCSNNLNGVNFCHWSSWLGFWSLPYLFLLTSILVSIFIIDFEHQFIPDELTYLLTFIGVSTLVVSGGSSFFLNILSGFALSTILLGLHFVTKGRGMGLGDVKLAIPLGIILGWPNIISFLFSAFMVGGLVATVLLILKKIPPNKTLKKRLF